MDVKQVNANLQNGDAFLLDVRSHGEFEAVHAPNAVLIPVQQLPGRISEIPTDKPVYVMCHSGGRSSMAVELLKARGLDNVTNVNGGIMAWQAAHLPVEPQKAPGGLMSRLLGRRG